MKPPSAQGSTFLGLPKLPARYAGLVMPLLLSIFMSGVISLISTLRGVGMAPGLLQLWLGAWGMSWLIGFPTLLLALPVVRKLTGFIVKSA